MSEPVDILAFSAHPDDVELSCSGTLMLAVEQGLRVAVADLSAGEMASRGTPEQRERERDDATALMGVCARVCLGLPDTRIGADVTHREPVVELLRRMRPRIVLAPHSVDRHPDHAAAGKLVRDACYFAGVAKLDGGPAHRPQRVFHYQAQSTAEPSFVIDISSVWVRKVEAIRAYRSQFSAHGSGHDTALSRPDFMRFIEARAIWLGALIGTAYGEAFILSGPVPLRGLPDAAPGGNGRPDPLPPYSAS